jgi:hypothetical protein
MVALDFFAIKSGLSSGIAEPFHYSGILLAEIEKNWLLLHRKNPNQYPVVGYVGTASLSGRAKVRILRGVRAVWLYPF